MLNRSLILSPCRAALVCATLLMGGCGGGDPSTVRFGNAQPLLEQGKESQLAGEWMDAINAYQQALEIDPNLPKAHLELGLLYDEHRKDNIRAIYHYQRYLELDPTAEKAKFVEELIRFAKRSFLESMPGSTSEAVQEITRLKGQITQLEQDLADSRKTISDQNVLLKNAEARIAQATRRPVPVPAAAPPEAAAEEPPRQRTYTVKRGDNLSRIAAKVYNDSSRWRGIYDANRDTLKKPEDLSVGQTLVIPE